MHFDTLMSVFGPFLHYKTAQYATKCKMQHNHVRFSERKNPSNLNVPQAPLGCWGVFATLYPSCVATSFLIVFC